MKALAVDLPASSKEGGLLSRVALLLLGCLLATASLGAWVEYQEVYAFLAIDWLSESELERVLFGLSFVLAAGLLAGALRLVFRAGKRMRLRGLRSSESGTVVAEFALVLPIVILLFGTLIQLSLLANTAVMLRYAAFAAARSAIVSFESDTSLGVSTDVLHSASVMSQFPPFPELVDLERPTMAAALVMAGVSPRPTDEAIAPVLLEELMSGVPELDLAADQLDAYLAANSQGRWQSGSFAPRVHYAWKALTIESISDSILDLEGMVESYPPLIPEPSHAIQPAQQEQSGVENAYTLPAPPSVESLIPDSIEVPFTIPAPAEVKTVLSLTGMGGALEQSVEVPLDMLKEPAKEAGVFEKIDGGIDFLRTGSGEAIQAYAESPANVDPMSPKEVAISLAYQAHLTLPSLFQFLDSMPLFDHLVDPAPMVSGLALNMDFKDYFTVRLQSTGSRRAPWGMIPFWFDFDVSKLKPEEGKKVQAPFEMVWNLPLYWIPRKGEKPAVETGGTPGESPSSPGPANGTAGSSGTSNGSGGTGNSGTTSGGS